MRRSARILGSVAAIGIALHAREAVGDVQPRADAATAATATADARRHFDRGITLYNEGEYGAARGELDSAYQLAPSYRLLYDIGVCAEAQGDLVAAIERLEQYLAEGGAAIDANRRTETDERLERLRSRVALITLRLNVAPDEATLLVDEQPRPFSSKPVMVLPGRRKLWVAKPGYYPATQTVTLEDGERAELSFELKPLGVSPPPPQAWWDARGVRWAAPLAGGLLIAGLTLGVVRSRRRRSTRALVHFNPYDTGTRADEVVEPGPEQALSIPIDDAGRTSSADVVLVLAVAAATDQGLVKPSNEDSYLVDVERGLMVVADGIGGFAGGEVASRIAVDSIKSSFVNGPSAGLLTHLPPGAGELARAVLLANHAIRVASAADANIADMGTTCVAARLSIREHTIAIAHIGDSRAYRLRGGKLTQLTTDHTMGGLGVVGRRAEHLSRALGTEPSPRVDVLLGRLDLGDIYLLCCDGLTKMASEDEIRGILSSAASAAEATTALVAAANGHGGLDNITVVVIAVGRGLA